MRVARGAIPEIWFTIVSVLSIYGALVGEANLAREPVVLQFVECSR